MRTGARVLALLDGKRCLVSFRQATSGKTFNYFTNRAVPNDFCMNDQTRVKIRMIDSGGYDSGDRACANALLGWYMGNFDNRNYNSWDQSGSTSMGRISTRNGELNNTWGYGGAFFRVKEGADYGASFGGVYPGDEANVYTCG